MKLILIFILTFIVFINANSEELFYDTSNSKDVDNFNKQARNDFLLSNFSNSVLSFDKSLGIEPDNTYALLHQGYAYTELGEFDKARDNYKKIFKKFPIHLTAFNAIGDTYFLENNFNEAQIWYEKTLKENQFENYALLKLADIHLKQSDYENALTGYDYVLSLRPSEQKILFNAKLGKGISYYHLGDYSLAQMEFSYIIKNGNIPEKIMAHTYNGLSFKQTNDFTTAQMEFDNAKSFDTKIIALQTEKNRVSEVKNLLPEEFDFSNSLIKLDKNVLYVLLFIASLGIAVGIPFLLALLKQRKNIKHNILEG